MAEHAWRTPESIGLKKRHLPLLVPLPLLATLTGPFEQRIATALAQELSLTRSMPPDFFNIWPTETNSRWLILLDALDEVPGKQRPSFMRWLSGTLKQLKPNHVIVTARSSSYRDGDLSAKRLKRYDILPFTPEQTTQFANKWFGKDAPDFLKSFQRTNVGDLQRTPLLLAIAAKVFIEYHHLPERRARLYENFVTIAITEARQKGLDTELGDRLDKVSVLALSRIARFMVEVPRSNDEPGLLRDLAAYFREALNMSRDESLVDSKRFVDIMTQRSGLLFRRGKVLTFIHPTIQEYLAATSVVHECGTNLDELWQKYISKWKSRKWREIALFSLGILSEQNIDVGNLFRQVMPAFSTSKLKEKIDQHGLDAVDEFLSADSPLMFATEAIRDGIELATSEYDRIANYYLTILHYLDQSDLIEITETASSPFEGLRMLRASPKAEQALRQFTRNRNAGGYLRYLAMETLLYLHESESDIQLLIAWGLGREALYLDSSISYSARTDIAELLFRMDRKSASLSVVSSLLRDAFDIDDTDRETAIELWMDIVGILGQQENFNALKDLKYLIGNPNISTKIFDKIMRFLRQNNFVWAADFLRQVALDEDVDDWRRCGAALTLADIDDRGRARYLILKVADSLNDSYAKAYIEKQYRNIFEKRTMSRIKNQVATNGTAQQQDLARTKRAKAKLR